MDNDMVYRKAFEQKEYDDHDARAKQAIRNHLDSLGVYTIVREDYNADILSFMPVKHEAEIKKAWIAEWPLVWDTLQIPGRKKRLLGKGKIVFWVLKNDLTEAWMVKGEYLDDSMLKVVPNKAVKDGEKLYCVPISKCKKIIL